MPKIITTHVFPPIPIRSMDWSAHYDGEEDEHTPSGEGATRDEAVKNLLSDHPRDDLTQDIIAILKLYSASTYGISIGELAHTMEKLGLVKWLPGPAWASATYGITDIGQIVRDYFVENPDG